MLLAARALAAPLVADEHFEITAHSVEFVAAGQLYVADGDVLLVQGERRLRADWAAISLASRRGVASGRIRLDDGRQWVEAEFMYFDLDRLEGTLFRGEIDTGPGGFLIEGRELHKTGKDDYEIERGLFTACRCPAETARPPWRIDAGRADVELGGYGEATNSTIDVLGVPILWIPWLVYPVKTERETGLLLPELAYGGNNGFQAGIPFFWAARPDVGLIFTPGYLSERGAKADLDVEYLLGRHSGGSFYGSFLLDQTALPDHATAYDRERWAARFEHDQSLPFALRARADLKAVSDNLYLDEFDDFGIYRRDLFLRSQIFGFGSFGAQGRIGAVAAMDFADDIQIHAIPRIDRDDTLLHRWPDLSLRALPARPGPLEPLGLVSDLDARYTYFHSRRDPQRAQPFTPIGPEGYYLDTGVDPAPLGEFGEGDGIYQPGEPMIQQGHRLLLLPRLARPFQLGQVVDVYPELGYGATLYDGGQTGFGERGVFSARGEARSRLRGTLQLGNAPSVSHLLEPYTSFTWVRPRSQRGNPVFVPQSLLPQLRLRQLEPENRVRDPSDQIVRSTALAAGFDNRFRLQRPGNPLGEVLTELRLGYEHDFERRDPGQAVLDARSYYRSWLRSDLGLTWNASTRHFDEGLGGIQLRAPTLGLLGNGYAELHYRFLRDSPLLTDPQNTPIHQLDVGFGVTLIERLLLGYWVVYSLDSKERLASGGSVVYASGCRCWSLGLDLIEDTTHDLYFRVRYSITGFGGGRADPFGASQGVYTSDAVR